MASQSHGGINEIIKNKNFGCIYKNQEELIKNITDFSRGIKKFNLTKMHTLQHLENFSISHNIRKYSKIFKEI